SLLPLSSSVPSFSRAVSLLPLSPFPFFFFNDPAPTEIYTLSLHDALPICDADRRDARRIDLLEDFSQRRRRRAPDVLEVVLDQRSEEHTSELQSLTNLVCRLLLEKKKKKITINDDKKQDKKLRSSADRLTRPRFDKRI